MKDFLQWGWLAGAVVCISSCAGGQFVIDPGLSQGPELTVEGPLGFNAYECDPKQNPMPKGLGEDRSASIQVAGLSGTATPLRRELATQKIFGDVLIRDYRAFLSQLAELRAATEGVLGTEASSSVGNAPEGEVTGNVTVDQYLNGIKFVLALPESATESTGFGFAGQIEGRTVVAACRTTQTARVFSAFDGPRFALHCKWASPKMNAQGEWNVDAIGSWSNYAFVGELKSEAGDVARFASQNVTVLGMGGVRGFDWKAGDGGVAALSFWQRPGPRPANLPQGKEPPYEPRAWLGRSLESKPGFRDGILISVALSYLFPWPSECDNKRLRAGAMETAK